MLCLPHDEIESREYKSRQKNMEETRFVHKKTTTVVL